MMTPQEGYERYGRAKEAAETALMEVLFAEGTIEDYHDAVEIMVLWRLSLEGHALTAMTNARLIEATNPPEDPPSRE